MTQASTSPGAQPDVAELRQSVEQIDRQIQDLRRMYAAMRTQTIVASLIILVVILLFGWMTYRAARENLAPERLQEAALIKAQQIWPRVQAQLTDALLAAAPAYQAEAQKRLQTIRPQLEQRFREEAERLPTVIHARLQRELQASLDRVGQRVAERVKADFPALADEDLKTVGDKLAADLSIEGGELAEYIKALQVQELHRLEAALEGLPVQSKASASKEDLETELMHHVIMLIDYHLLHPEDPLGIAAEALPAGIGATDQLVPGVPGAPAPQGAAPESDEPRAPQRSRPPAAPRESAEQPAPPAHE